MSLNPEIPRGTFVIIIDHFQKKSEQKFYLTTRRNNDVFNQDYANYHRNKAFGIRSLRYSSDRIWNVINNCIYDYNYKRVIIIGFHKTLELFKSSENRITPDQIKDKGVNIYYVNLVKAFNAIQGYSPDMMVSRSKMILLLQHPEPDLKVIWDDKKENSSITKPSEKDINWYKSRFDYYYPKRTQQTSIYTLFVIVYELLIKCKSDFDKFLESSKSTKEVLS